MRSIVLFATRCQEQARSTVEGPKWQEAREYSMEGQRNNERVVAVQLNG